MTARNIAIAALMMGMSSVAFANPSELEVRCEFLQGLGAAAAKDRDQGVPLERSLRAASRHEEEPYMHGMIRVVDTAYALPGHTPDEVARVIFRECMLGMH